MELDIRIRDEWIEVVARGSFDLDESVEGFPALAAFASEVGLFDVLVDYRGLGGEAGATEEIIYATQLGERYAQYRAGGGTPMRIAYVGNDNFVRSWQPGIEILQGFGLEGFATTELDDAAAWLRRE